MTASAWNIIYFPDFLAVKYMHLRLSIKVNLCRFDDSPNLKVLGVMWMKMRF